MKKFAPHLLVLVAGCVMLALSATDALAQACQHMHQLSKKLNAQQITSVACKLCVCEKMETYYVKHRIRASILADCDCDETNDRECNKLHQHPNSGDGDFEGWACVWSPSDDTTGPIIPPDGASYQSSGIPNDCIFDATITRWVKYCKDSTDNPGLAYPRAGYHSGTWTIRCGTEKLANGSLSGVDGVDPSYERPYALTTWVDDSGEEFESRDFVVRKAHDPLPGGQSNSNVVSPDFCDGANCYLAGWQVGCLSGATTNLFFRFQCPPTGTYDKDEVSNIADCPLGDLFVINDFRGKQICITPVTKWVLKACYSGGNAISPTKLPCAQWADQWSVRLEGVISITATNCIQ